MGEEAAKQRLLAEINSLRDPRGFIKAGLPRFDRLFGRDSLIVAWQLLEIDPSICQATLEVLSETQGTKFDPLHEEEPGKIVYETDDKPHPEHPDKILFPYYGSVDSTPLYVILATMFCVHTGCGRSRPHREKLWPNVKTALNWILKYGDADGDSFLEYERKGRGLFHQGWKDGFENHLGIKPPVAIVEAQGYAYLALKEAAHLTSFLNKGRNSAIHCALPTDEAVEYGQQADKLKENFNRQFWMEKGQFFALALDGDKKQKKTITSNPGHLLFTGIVEERYLKPLVNRLFEPDLWTPYGIRTHSTREPNFDPLSYHLGSVWPHDNWIIAQGLKKIGADKEYRRVRGAILKAYQELGFAPEHFGVVDGKLIEIPSACHPQAWSSGAVLNFLTS